MSNPVPPIVGAFVPIAWVGGAIFGGDDLTEVHKALPIYLAIQDGSPRPLQEASQTAGQHAAKQEKFATDADKLRKLLSEAWDGDSAEKAAKKVKDLAVSARETGASLAKNSKSFEVQAGAFDTIKHSMKPMDNPPPEGSGFWDRLAPWDTGAEEAVERNQDAAKHNLSLYDKYSQTSKSNAEALSDRYGSAGNPGQQPQQPYNPNERTTIPGDKYTPPGMDQSSRDRAAEQRRQAEEQARKAREEAQRRAEEQRRKMEEDARRQRAEAERRAEEQRRKMEHERRNAEEEARRRQEEAQRRAEEQRRKMEEEARRQRAEAEERARRAREQMAGSGGFSPSSMGSTAASSFSPSDFAGAGSGAGAGSFGGGAGGTGAEAGRSSGALAAGMGGPGAAGGGAGGAARGGMGGMRGGMGMGGMMGGAGAGGKGSGDKEHKRKIMATEDPNQLFGTDEKSVPPVIGDK